MAVAAVDSVQGGGAASSHTGAAVGGGPCWGVVDPGVGACFAVGGCTDTVVWQT